MIGISNQLGGLMLATGVAVLILLRTCGGWFVSDDETVVTIAAIVGSCVIFVFDLGYRMLLEKECVTFADRFEKYYSINTGGFFLFAPVWGWGLMFTAGSVASCFK